MSNPGGLCPGLWGIWLTWGLALILWVGAGNGELYLHPTAAGIVVALWCAVCGGLVMTLQRGKRNMRFMTKKTPEAEQTSPTSPLPVQPAPVQAPGILHDVVVKSIRKDVFIAPGAHFSGVLKADGNIVTEGCVEGNIIATHQVRVDNGGVVKGDIRAAHIIINGLVTGRCYAGEVTLLAQGRIEGDVFTDELSVERGGVFIGQSSQSQPEQIPEGQGRNNVTGFSLRDTRAMEAHLKKAAKMTQNELSSAVADVPQDPDSAGSASERQP